MEYYEAGTGKGPPQIVATNSEAQNCLELHFTLSIQIATNITKGFSLKP